MSARLIPVPSSSLPYHTDAVTSFTCYDFENHFTANHGCVSTTEATEGKFRAQRTFTVGCPCSTSVCVCIQPICATLGVFIHAMGTPICLVIVGLTFHEVLHEIDEGRTHAQLANARLNLETPFFPPPEHLHSLGEPHIFLRQHNLVHLVRSRTCRSAARETPIHSLS